MNGEALLGLMIIAGIGGVVAYFIAVAHLGAIRRHAARSEALLQLMTERAYGKQPGDLDRG